MPVHFENLLAFKASNTEICWAQLDDNVLRFPRHEEKEIYGTLKITFQLPSIKQKVSFASNYLSNSIFYPAREDEAKTRHSCLVLIGNGATGRCQLQSFPCRLPYIKLTSF